MEGVLVRPKSSSSSWGALRRGSCGGLGGCSICAAAKPGGAHSCLLRRTCWNLEALTPKRRRASRHLGEGRPRQTCQAMGRGWSLNH